MENKVLALVEGREIKESDLKLLVKNLGQNAAYFQGEEGRKKLIEELVMHELMYLDAVERNLESEEEFLEVFKEMKRSMLQQYNLRKMFNSITLSDEELKDFYYVIILFFQPVAFGNTDCRIYVVGSLQYFEYSSGNRCILGQKFEFHLI
jgi:hypothetical protein